MKERFAIWGTLPGKGGLFDLVVICGWSEDKKTLRVLWPDFPEPTFARPHEFMAMKPDIVPHSLHGRISPKQDWLFESEPDARTFLQKLLIEIFTTSEND